jgi:PleD family two-component response regulator
VPEIKDDPRAVILRADQALYSAKAKGRDRVEAVQA